MSWVSGVKSSPPNLRQMQCRDLLHRSVVQASALLQQLELVQAPHRLHLQQSGALAMGRPQRSWPSSPAVNQYSITSRVCLRMLQCEQVRTKVTDVSAWHCTAVAFDDRYQGVRPLLLSRAACGCQLCPARCPQRFHWHLPMFLQARQVSPEGRDATPCIIRCSIQSGSAVLVPALC